MFYSTERLNLRSYKESDLERILELWNELDVQQNTSTEHVVPRGPKFKDTVKGWVSHPFILLCHLNQSLNVIGSVGSSSLPFHH